MRIKWVSAAVVAVAAQLAPTLPAHALTLISEEEARRPGVAAPAPLDLRGVTRGPTITVVSPVESAPAKSPLALKVQFAAHGGSNIDVASVKVTYLKSPAIDLTERLKPFISAGGIELNQADVAAGRHVVRIDLKDAQGRRSSSIVNFSVAP
ncbi:MAG: hypothetical protein HY060_06945 [Proteobacteria bacterium]|nr:hypothetical protein [Pseudomonadota bacterium]